jgi:hypothetical protein
MASYCSAAIDPDVLVSANGSNEYSVEDHADRREGPKLAESASSTKLREWPEWAMNGRIRVIARSGRSTPDCGHS